MKKERKEIADATYRLVGKYTMLIALAFLITWVISIIFGWGYTTDEVILVAAYFWVAFTLSLFLVMVVSAIGHAIVKKLS